MGSEEPAPGVVEHLQRTPPQGRAHPGVPVVQLDRVRHLVLHWRREDQAAVHLLRPPAQGVSARRDAAGGAQVHAATQGRRGCREDRALPHRRRRHLHRLRGIPGGHGLRGDRRDRGVPVDRARRPPRRRSDLRGRHGRPQAGRVLLMTTLLRLATAGSVDDGKSTLIGRLLYDSKAVMEDQLASVERTSKERGHDYTDLALVTDGLRAEREQGITIDVAYRYFATPRRKFIIADTPGHTQYTRNMVTGTSTAQLAIVLVDARHGLLEQSRRHAFLASLLGIRHIVLAVNKMDLIGWDREQFEKIRDDFHEFAARLDIHDVTTIPLSALLGDNVVTKSDNTPWYDGPSLLSHLEEVYIAGDRNLVDVRFPVQYVIRPQTHEHRDHRSYAGTVASGVMRPGDEVVVLPIGKTSRIAEIEGPNGAVAEAFPPMAVSVSLADEIDISRGDMIARTNNQPRIAQQFDATVCWMADAAALEPGRDYVIKHTTRTTRARITALDYRLDVNTLHRDKTATALKLNELGRITLRTQVPLLLDEYTRNSATGSFILIDPTTNGTVAAGMILPFVSARTSSPNTVRHESLCNADDRLSQGRTVWFTGLSGSGKSWWRCASSRSYSRRAVPPMF